MACRRWRRVPAATKLKSRARLVKNSSSGVSRNSRVGRGLKSDVVLAVELGQAAHRHSALGKHVVVGQQQPGATRKPVAWPAMAPVERRICMRQTGARGARPNSSQLIGTRSLRPMIRSSAEPVFRPREAQPRFVDVGRQSAGHARRRRRAAHAAAQQVFPPARPAPARVVAPSPEDRRWGDPSSVPLSPAWPRSTRLSPACLPIRIPGARRPGAGDHPELTHMGCQARPQRPPAGNPRS